MAYAFACSRPPALSFGACSLPVVLRSGKHAAQASASPRKMRVLRPTLTARSLPSRICLYAVSRQTRYASQNSLSVRAGAFIFKAEASISSHLMLGTEVANQTTGAYGGGMRGVKQEWGVV